MPEQTVAETRRDALISPGIFALALLVGSVKLGQFLTADEPRSWLGWSIEFARALLNGRWGDTFFSFAPGVTVTWLGSAGLYLNYLFGGGQAANFADFLANLPFDPVDPAGIFWFRLPAVIVGAACAALTYPLARRTVGPKIALAGALLFTLDPLRIGMSRVLGTDGLAAAFMAVSTLSALAFFLPAGTPSRRLLVLSGVSGGLAMLSKTTAVFLLPTLGLAAAAAMLHRRDFRRPWEYVRPLLWWGALAGLTVVALWPSLWVEPLGTLQHAAAWLSDTVDAPHNRGSFFMGQPVPDPGPAFYWVIAFFRLTTVTTVGLGLAAFAGGSRVKTRSPLSRRATALLLLAAFALLFVLFLSTGSKKQDRYITPLMPALDFLAAAGWVWAAEKIAAGRKGRLALAAVIGLQAAIAGGSYPYYLSHYNLLAGGGPAAARTVLVGWGEGLDRAAGYLNSLPNADALTATAWYHSTFEPYFRGRAIERVGDEKLSRSAKPWLMADYAVLYTNQIQRQMPTPGLLQFLRASPPEYVARMGGIDYAAVYRSVGMQHGFASEARLVGQAELLGYNLFDEAGRPVAAAYPDSVAYLSLYWEWQGKAEAEPVGVSLVDAGGVTRGWGNPVETVAPLPFEAWQEGMVVRDDFALLIFADTPPGDYRLAAWIDRPATGETVGVFPLAGETITVVARPNE